MSPERVTTAKSRNREYRFKNASLNDITADIDDTLITLRNNPAIDSVYGFYAAVATKYADPLSPITQRMIVEAAQTGNEQGRKAFLFLNMKSIIAGVSPYFSNLDADYNDDIIQQGVTSVLTSLNTLVADSNMTSKIRTRAKDGAIKVIAEKAHLASMLIEKEGVDLFHQQADHIFSQHPYGLTKEQLSEYSQKIASRVNLPEALIGSYLHYRNETLPKEVYRKQRYPSEQQVILPDFITHDLDLVLLRPVLVAALQKLPPREARIVTLLEEGISLQELAAEYGVTSTRIEHIRDGGYTKLRRILRREESPFIGVSSDMYG